MITNVYWAPSRIHGRGIFTREYIHKGDEVRLPLKKVLDMEASGHGGLNVLVNGNLEGEWSYKANISPASRGKRLAEATLSYFALRDIAEGEELTLKVIPLFISRFDNPIYFA